MSKPLELRQQVIEARIRFGHSEISIDELYRICDLYREAIREYSKRSKKKIRIPSRAYLLRAL
jgi:DNA-directed RNA polymerase sigma subunit (sigma70/sigma32)